MPCVRNNSTVKNKRTSFLQTVFPGGLQPNANNLITEVEHQPPQFLHNKLQLSSKPLRQIFNYLKLYKTD